MAQLVKNLPAMHETLFNSWIGKICWRRDRLPTPVCLGFSGGSAGKESTCNSGGSGFDPWVGKKEEVQGNLLHYSCLENPTERGAYGLQFIGLQRVGHN